MVLFAYNILPFPRSVNLVHNLMYQTISRQGLCQMSPLRIRVGHTSSFG